MKLGISEKFVFTRLNTKSIKQEPLRFSCCKNDLLKCVLAIRIVKNNPLGLPNIVL